MEFAFLQGANDTSDLTTYTYSTQNLGTADADRYIIVAVQGRAIGSVTIASVTVGGVAATEVIQVTNTEANSTMAGLFIAAVPTGTTGDVVVTFSAGALRSAIQLYRAVGIASATASDTGSSIVDDPTTSLDVPAGGFAIGSAICAAPTFESWSGITEDYATDLETAIRVTSASLEFASQQTGLLITCDFSTTASHAAGVFASWAPAGGAPPPTNLVPGRKYLGWMPAA